MDDLVRAIAAGLLAKKWFLSTAESCTGGLIGHELTNLPGSSQWYMGGVVAYSNWVKREVLGVSEEILMMNGAVSQEAVEAMAQTVAMGFNACVSLAVSGVAGPDGGTPDKPVGTVWMAWKVTGKLATERFNFTGDRLSIKTQSARAALAGLVERLA